MEEIVWVYVIISGIVFIWLWEHFYLENKETGEKYGMEENWRALIVGVIIAIEWLIAIPIFVIPMIKRGGDE